MRAKCLGFHLGVFCDQVLDCQCQGRGAQTIGIEGFLRVASLRFSSDFFQARVFLEIRQAGSECLKRRKIFFRNGGDTYGFGGENVQKWW